MQMLTKLESERSVTRISRFFTVSEWCLHARYVRLSTVGLAQPTVRLASLPLGCVRAGHTNTALIAHDSPQLPPNSCHLQQNSLSPRELRTICYDSLVRNTTCRGCPLIRLILSKEKIGGKKLNISSSRGEKLNISSSLV